MGKPNRATRTGSHARRGRLRADTLANRLATAIREGRLIEGVTQLEAANRGGISQPRWSELERGLGAGASIETWSIAAAAVGSQLAAFLEGAPGAERPRDIEHARRQSALIEFAASGGWRALPELAVDPAVRSRSIDVALVRELRREAAPFEIWDWFDDIGASFRGLDAKTHLLGERLKRDPQMVSDQSWRIAGCFVVRDTARNRRLVAELRPLFVARFPGSSSAWLHALRDPAAPMPGEDALLWSDRGGRVSGSHLRRY
jgi:transcriptional regulator with XRE-family HTH domain